MEPSSIQELKETLQGWFASRDISRRAEPEDLAQETIRRLLAWEERNRDATEDRLRRVAFGIAKHVVADAVTAPPQPVPPVIKGPALSPEAEDELYYRLALAFREAVLQPPRQRELTLEYILQYMEDEQGAVERTGAALEVSPNYVAVSFYRFRQLLAGRGEAGYKYPTTVVQAVDIEERWGRAGHPPIDRLNGYVAGELERAEFVAVMLHLVKCNACFDYVRGRRE